MAWLPALLLAQLTFSVWAACRALPAGGAWQLVALAVGNQLLFLLRALPILFLLSWPLLALRPARLRLPAVGVLWSLFLLLQAGLEQYYLTSRVPLGADLFGYGLAEIRTTVGGAADSGIGLAGWAALLVPLALLWSLLVWRARPRHASASRALPAMLLIGAAAWLLPTTVGANGLRSDAARDFVTSKGAYFVADNLRWARSDASAVAAPVAAAAQDAVNPEYPFLRRDTTPDALGPYFGPTRDGRPPNIVVIVVEGLGRSFSGPGAALGSFTPFLDELAARSLYFDNFMANQGRTFGVLPSLFGSLPTAEQGFTALGPKMPAHPGLFNVLRRQGYHTAFYGGFDSSFDNERSYLRLQEVDDLVDLHRFGPGYPINSLDSWGYADRELFSRVLADNARLRPPFVLGVQTMSMHPLYRFPGQAAYLVQVEQRLEALGIPASRREAYREHAGIYSTILYTDDQLRRYFDAVKTAPWYEDTIFVVTGDHRLPEIPQDTYVERYHVPLLVFSPLLRQSARIGAVSSHLDVTPSLLALLAHAYGLQRPAQASWIGRGLDMAGEFRSGHDFPIRHTKTSGDDYVAGRWLLHDGRVYELQGGIRATEVDDDALRAQVTQRLRRYQAANASFLRKLELSPEGGKPSLVAFDAAVAAPLAAEPAAQPLPAGLGLDAAKLQRTADGVEALATFVNGDAGDSRDFVPLAVLADADGRELREAYGSLVRLRGHERREVALTLAMPALAPGRYYVSVLPSDPDSGKPLGRGRYRIPLDVAEGGR